MADGVETGTICDVLSQFTHPVISKQRICGHDAKKHGKSSSMATVCWGRARSHTGNSCTRCNKTKTPAHLHAFTHVHEAEQHIHDHRNECDTADLSRCRGGYHTRWRAVVSMTQRLLRRRAGGGLCLRRCWHASIGCPMGAAVAGHAHPAWPRWVELNRQCVEAKLLPSMPGGHLCRAQYHTHDNACGHSSPVSMPSHKHGLAEVSHGSSAERYMEAPRARPADTRRFDAVPLAIAGGAAG